MKLEQFPISSRKTKTTVITVASHKGHTQLSERIEIWCNYRLLMQGGEKDVLMSYYLVLVADWMKKGYKLFMPIMYMQVS